MAAGSRRSSPAFAIGGVSWLDQHGECHGISLPIEGRWRCFICGETFSSVASAERHFGTNPKSSPRCETAAWRKRVLTDWHEGRLDAAITKIVIAIATLKDTPAS